MTAFEVCIELLRRTMNGETFPEVKVDGVGKKEWFTHSLDGSTVLMLYVSRLLRCRLIVRDVVD